MEENEQVCRNRHCHVLLNGQCEIGESSFRKCPNFSSASKSIEDVDGQGEESEILGEVRQGGQGREDEVSFTFAWHSHVFGLDDIRYLAARSQLQVIGLFGAYNAGKSTFLAALYLLLMNGITLDTKFFAGSLTFGGWESLTHSLKLPGKRFSSGKFPHFPPHTQSRNTPVPGLLHLAYRNARDEFRDYLFTDPPGEWFERWADNEDDPFTEGARWMARRATAIAIFADSDALAGPQRGVERLRLSSLMLRISSSTCRQPVALVWAKADISVKDVIKDRIEREFNEYFQGRQTQIFRIAAVPKDNSSKMKRGQGVLDVVKWLMDSALRREAINMFSVENDDSFLLYRG